MSFHHHENGFEQGKADALNAIQEDGGTIQSAQHHLDLARGDLHPTDFTKGWKHQCEQFIKNPELPTPRNFTWRKTCKMPNKRVTISREDNGNVAIHIRSLNSDRTIQNQGLYLKSDTALTLLLGLINLNDETP